MDTVAIITGASSGIGEAVALALAERGARLTLTARRRERLADVARKVESGGGTALILPADLRNDTQLTRVFSDSQEYWGRLDVLVNSAGVGIEAPIHDGCTDAWRAMWETNVHAVALTMREALTRFDPASGGHIINISSTSAHRVPPGGGFYAATKFAVRALTEILRQELVLRNSRTRVGSVSPGRVATDFFDVSQSGLDPSAAVDAGMLLPADVAAVVLQILDAPAHVDIHDVLLRSKKQNT